MKTPVYRRNRSQTAASSVRLVSIPVVFAMGVGLFDRGFAADDDFIREVDTKEPVVARINTVQERQLYLFLFGDTFLKNRRDLDARIDQRVREIGFDYRLTAAEYESIRLASRADRVRFDRQIADWRNAYEGLQQQPLELNQLVVSVHLGFKDLPTSPHPDSFLEKKIKTVLAEKGPVLRVGEHHVFSSDLLRNRYLADVEAAVRAVERTVPLRRYQRLDLIELMLKETEPAKVFGDFDDVLIKYRMSQLPEKKLKPLFDEDQWPKVMLAMDGFREFGPFLKHHGLLVNEIVASSKEKQPADPGSGVDRRAPADLPLKPGEN